MPKNTQIIKQFREKFTHLDDKAHRLKSVDSEGIESFLTTIIDQVEKDCYQNAADNFGYLASSDGNLRTEAQALHEHFQELANKKP
jgi:glutamate mutase epsilon subunit